MKLRECYFRAALAVVLSVLPSVAFAQPPCDITAPASVDYNETFTLCGPSGARYQYEWYGPGVEVNNTSRCVTARVSQTGTHEFLLIISRDDAELTRCRALVNVGGATGGARSCAISGPNSIRFGERARLCSPDDGLHTYRWEGPNGFTATSACIDVREEGTYFLTSRNKVTNRTRQCTHRLSVVDAPDEACDITGPSVIPVGSTVRLCAPSRSNTSYQWTGPRNFSSSSLCVTVRDPGIYSVRMRNSSSGRVERCSRTLTLSDDGNGEEDPDGVIYDNCPRDYIWWRNAFAARGRSGAFTQAELRDIARIIDERSRYFNWTNDVQGARDVLNPTGPITRGKQVARQFAALLANVAAGELGLTAENGDQVGLDPDTRVTYPGVTSIRELIASTERTLNTRRGSYARLNSTLNAINRGRGIDSTCE